MFPIRIALGFPQSLCLLHILRDATGVPGCISHYASNFDCHWVRCCKQLLGKCKHFSFLFQARWQHSQQPFKYTRGSCYGGEEYFLSYHYHMTPVATISEQISVLTKSVILKTRMLVFLLHLCMTYGLPVSGYSVSAQHLVFSDDYWSIWICMVFPYVPLVLLQLLGLLWRVG